MRTIFNKIISGSLLLLATMILPSCAEIEFPEHSSENAMGNITLSVRVPQLDPDKVVYEQIKGVVDHEAKTVTFDVPYNMSEVLEEVTDLSHTYIVASVPTSAIITPGLGGIQDLTAPKDITITAADGTKVNYTLIANLKKSADANILDFNFSIGETVFTGLCINLTKTVSYMVPDPDMVEIIAVTPSIGNFVVSPRAKIVSPDITQPLFWGEDVEIVVEAQDGSRQSWTVTQAAPEILDYGFGYTKATSNWSNDFLGFGQSLDVRGMTVTKNYLVIHDRYMEHKLYNKETGAFVGKTPVPADLSDSNKAAGMYVCKDAEGNLVGGSFSSWTSGSKFVVYYYPNGETAQPVRILEVAGLGDCGRKMAVVGSLKSGVAHIYATQGKGAKVYRFKFVDGVYDSLTTITVAPASGDGIFTYMCTPLPLDNTENSKFILVDQIANGFGSVGLFNADGSMVSKMTNNAMCQGGGLTADGKVFNFNNARYMIYNDQAADNKSARIRIYDITNLDNFAMSSSHPEFYTNFLKFTAENMAISASNGNGTGVVDFDLAEDGETMFVYNMLTAGNVVKYELTKIKLPE